MEGIVFGIQRMSTHNGPGIRTTVFLKGCPLQCIWCHNPESQGLHPELAYLQTRCTNCGQCENSCPNSAHTFLFNKHLFDRTKCIGCGICTQTCKYGALILYGKKMNVSDVMTEISKDQEFYGNDGGVTFSGGEPMIQIDFLKELLQECKQMGYHTAIDTCGFSSKANFEKIIEYTDLFLYDIKHIDNKSHIILTGKPNISILENLKHIDRLGCKVEIRIPLIPLYNTEPAVIHGIGAFLGSLSNILAVRLLRYNPYCGSKYEHIGKINQIPTVDPLNNEKTSYIADILKAYGLKVFS